MTNNLHSDPSVIINPYRFAAAASAFAYVDGVGVNFSGTLQSDHAFTLEAGEDYAGIAICRAVTVTSLATDQGDTVTERGEMTGGGDLSAAKGFEFTASDTSTTIELTANATGGARVIFLWKVTGAVFQASAGDTSASGASSLIEADINTVSGDVAMAAAFWSSGTGNITASNGLDTVDDTIVETRKFAAGSKANVTGGSPELFTINTDAGWKSGGGYFLIYR